MCLGHQSGKETTILCLKPSSISNLHAPFLRVKTFLECSVCLPLFDCYLSQDLIDLVPVLSLLFIQLALIADMWWLELGTV